MSAIRSKKLGPPICAAVSSVARWSVLTIVTSFGYTANAWRRTVGLLNAGSFCPGLARDHGFPLADRAAAFDALRGAQGARGRVILEV